jgi:hypothetical protein
MKAEYDFSQAKRGAIDPVGAGKTRITIRIDDDVLAWFREQVHLAAGGNYQTLSDEPLEARKNRNHKVRLIIYSPNQEVIVRWIE